MITGWRYDLIDRAGVRCKGTLAGDDLETEKKARAHLRDQYGPGADDADLVRSGDDTPDWLRQAVWPPWD